MNSYIIQQSDLTDMGLNLGEAEITSLLMEVNEELNGRVGVALMDELADEQLQEYRDFEEGATPEQKLKWFSERVKDVPQIVQDEVDIVLGELAERFDSIIDE